MMRMSMIRSDLGAEDDILKENREIPEVNEGIPINFVFINEIKSLLNKFLFDGLYKLGDRSLYIRC